MNVKDIIKLSADMLGRFDIVDFISSGKKFGSEAVLEDGDNRDEIQKDISNFLLAVNMVASDIASSYIELLSVSKVSPVINPIKYSSITDKSIIDIKSVKDERGNNVKFTLKPDGLYIDTKCTTCKIEYSYFLDEVGFDDTINEFIKLNEMTFALGVVSEYLFIIGDFENSYVWQKKFKNALFNLLRPKKNIVLPQQRGWL